MSFTSGGWAQGGTAEKSRRGRDVGSRCQVRCRGHSSRRRSPRCRHARGRLRRRLRNLLGKHAAPRLMRLKPSPAAGPCGPVVAVSESILATVVSRHQGASQVRSSEVRTVVARVTGKLKVLVVRDFDHSPVNSALRARFDLLRGRSTLGKSLRAGQLRVTSNAHSTQDRSGSPAHCRSRQERRVHLQ